MSDLSANIEMSANYRNFYRMDSGRIFLEFDASGGASERVLCKDPTGGNQTSNCFHIETISLACTSGDMALYDGSGGVRIFRIPGQGDLSIGNRVLQMDFRPDSLRCLTADNTQSLCVSAGNGFWAGHLTGWFGNA